MLLFRVLLTYFLCTPSSIPRFCFPCCFHWQMCKGAGRFTLARYPVLPCPLRDVPCKATTFLWKFSLCSVPERVQMQWDPSHLGTLASPADDAVALPGYTGRSLDAFEAFARRGHHLGLWSSCQKAEQISRQKGGNFFQSFPWSLSIPRCWNVK